MTSTANQLAADISDLIGRNFLDTCRMLRSTQEQYPELFPQILKLTGIGKRKAHYLLEIDRNLENLTVDRQRLYSIGWTKVQIIAGHLTRDNAGELLSLAEEQSAQSLKAMMKGKVPPAKSHCVVLYFAPDEYAVFERIALAHGAKRSGKGLANKERALGKAFRRMLDAGGKP